MDPYGFIQLDDATLVAHIDCAVYSRRAIFSTCYQYTDRCYIFLTQGEAPQLLDVVLSLKRGSQVDLNQIKGEFFNDLIDHELRSQIASETSDVRTLIVAQAFAEGNLLDQQNDASYTDDPRDIQKHS